MFSFLHNGKIDIIKNAKTPCIVAGNAPSLKEIDYTRLPFCNKDFNDFVDSKNSMDSICCPPPPTTKNIRKLTGGRYV